MRALGVSRANLLFLRVRVAKEKINIFKYFFFKKSIDTFPSFLLKRGLNPNSPLTTYEKEIP
jgi:hypothetical protein